MRASGQDTTTPPGRDDSDADGVQSSTGPAGSRPSWSGRRALLVALGASLVAALVLRLAYIDYALPHRTDPDCNVVWQGLYLDDRLNGVERAPFPVLDESYPTLLGAVLALLPGRLMPIAAGPDLESHLAAAARPMLLGRILAALAGVALVPLTFLLARRLVRPAEAAVATAIVATSFMLVLYSRQARPHVPAAALSLATVLVAARTARAPGLRGYLAAGALGGLSIACLQSGLAVLPALLAAHLVALRRAGRRTWIWALAGLALLSIGVVAGYAHVLFGLGQGDQPSVQGGTLFIGAHRIPVEAFSGGGFRKCLTFLWNYEPALAVTGGIGLLALVARAVKGRVRGSQDGAESRPDRIVALAFALPMVAMLGLYERIGGRFLTPLVPFIALLGAAGVVTLATGLSRIVPRAVALSVAVTGALAAPVFTGILLLAHQRRPDSLAEAAEWIRANVDREHEVIAAERFCSLPVFSAGFTRDLDFGATDIWVGDSFWLHLRVGAFSTWDLYEARLEPAFLQEQGYRIEGLLVSPDGLRLPSPEYRTRIEQRVRTIAPDYALVTIPGRFREEIDPTRKVVMASADLVRRFPLDAPVAPAQDTFHFDSHAALPTLLQKPGLGHNLELYRLRNR